MGEKGRHPVFISWTISVLGGGLVLQIITDYLAR